MKVLLLSIFIFSVSAGILTWTGFNLEGRFRCSIYNNSFFYDIKMWEADNLSDDLLKCEFGGGNDNWSLRGWDYTDGSPNFEIYVEVFHQCADDRQPMMYKHDFGQYPHKDITYNLTLFMDLSNKGEKVGEDTYLEYPCKEIEEEKDRIRLAMIEKHEKSQAAWLAEVRRNETIESNKKMNRTKTN